MSGPIRTSLGQVDKRISNYLSELNLENYKIVPDLTKSYEENLEIFEEIIDELEHKLSKLSSAKEVMEEKEEAWKKYIISLEGREREEEKALYEERMNQYVGNIDSARVAIVDIKSKIKELRNKIKIFVKEQNPIPGNNTGRPVHNINGGSVGSNDIRIESHNILGNPSVPPPRVLSARAFRIPEIYIPDFYGDMSSWLEFWQCFQLAVDSNTELSKIEKFLLLKKYLKGKAARTIAGYKLTDENYDCAVAVLKKRFGDSELIKHTLFTQLDKLVPASGRIDSLRNTLEKINETVNQLVTMGENPNNMQTIVLVEKKFPSLSRKIFQKKRQSPNWDLYELIDCIEEMILTEEVVNKYEEDLRLQDNRDLNRSNFRRGNRTSHIRTSQENVENFEESDNPMTTMSIQKNEKLSKNNIKEVEKNYIRNPYCIFCKKTDHWTSDCLVYKTNSERLEIIKKENRCFKCLRVGHRSSSCRSVRKCRKCNGDHNQAICPTREQGTVALVESDQLVPSEVNVNTLNMEGPENSEPFKEVTALLGVKVLVENPCDSNKFREALVFIDDGSELTFVTSELAKELSLPVINEKILQLCKFGNSKVTCPSKEVKMKLSLVDNSSLSLVANVVPVITNSIKYVSNSENLDVDNLKVSRGKPDILIGSDQIGKILALEKLPSGFFKIPSKLGDLIGGAGRSINCIFQNIGSQNSNSTETSLVNDTSGLHGLEENEHRNGQEAGQMLDLMCSLESFGIDEIDYKKEDDIALEKFQRDVRFVDDRIEVCYPWKGDDGKIGLKSNYELALYRLKSTVRTLQKRNLLEKYDEIIKEQLRLGIVEEVKDLKQETVWKNGIKEEFESLEEDNSVKNERVVHYIPHFPVIRNDRATTKVRIVYDASAKINSDEKSLNDCLLRGPVILPDLVGLLVRFRSATIPICADIEKAFLMVSVNPRDRDATRFFWINNLENPNLDDINDIVIYRFKRVAFGIISSPFLLGASVLELLKRENSLLAREISSNIYVDNVFLSANCLDEARGKYHESKKIFAKASMNLREYLSNSKEFMTSIPEKDRASSKTAKVLGLSWNLENDCFEFKYTFDLTDKLTKRLAAKNLASIYDPLGMLAPAILPLKLFQQKLWSHKFDWDEEIGNDELLNSWITLISDWNNSIIKVPRLLFHEVEILDLHTFVDASMTCFAAVVYIKANGENNQIKLVFSKNKLAPLNKRVSIPRMELLAIVLGTRASNYIRRELSKIEMIRIRRTIIWSDSQCAISWIDCLDTNKLERFVRNRVNEIHKCTNLSIRYVNTLDNPADYATRGVSPRCLMDNHCWWMGPEWLREDKSSWPRIKNVNLDELKSKKEKLLNISNKISKPFYSSVASMITLQSFPRFINHKYYSSWNKLVRIVTYCLKFLNLKIFRRLNKVYSKILEMIKQEKYIETAEILLIKMSQEEILEAEVKQFKLYMDPLGLFRCHDRLRNMNVCGIDPNPVFLPNSGHITKLIICDIHNRLLHSGVLSTLALFRQQFWTTRGRKLVKGIIKQCRICQTWRSMPYKRPQMGPLPKERLSRLPAFSNIGLDYMGPFNLKYEGTTVKRWVALFTCCNVRMIHLELVTDLSAKAFMNGFRKFIARRRCPRIVISDNASQFRLAERTIDMAWDELITQKLVKDFLEYNKIKWIFNPEYSPWYGGFFERLIGIVKSVMRKVVGRKFLNLDDFDTLIVQCEAVVNARPLTYLYDDLASTSILRPIDLFQPGNASAQFVLPYSYVSDPDEEYLPGKLDSRTELLNYWKKSESLIEKFWSLWRVEYLQSLRERPGNEHRDPFYSSKKLPVKNEVVLIQEENLPRNKWKLGKILDFKPSRDGNNRIAIVKVSSSGGKSKVINRPINYLYSLEIRDDLDNLKDQPDEGEIEQQDFELVNSLKDASLQGEGDRSLGAIQREQKDYIPYKNLKFLSYSYIMIIFCFLCHIFGVSAWECEFSENITTEVQVLGITECVEKGYVIMNTQKGICYVKHKCEPGHVMYMSRNFNFFINSTDARFATIESPFGPIKCIKKCLCPKWAKECSHYKGILSRQLILTPSQEAQLDKLKVKDICSLVKSKKCDDKSKMGKFYLIELYNGKIYYVKNLHIRKIDIADISDYQCFSIGGNISSDNVSGSPEYCELNACQLYARYSQRFCYYGLSDAFMMKTEIRDVEIPIYAYGLQSIEYFGYKKPSQMKHSTVLRSNLQNSTLDVSVQCSSKGITISNLQLATNFSVCRQLKCLGDKRYCGKTMCQSYNMTGNMPYEIVFEEYFTVYDYYYQLKVKEKHIEGECPAVSICKRITCTFCKKLNDNAHCVENFLIPWLYVFCFMFIFTSIAVFFVFMCQNKSCCQKANDNVANGKKGVESYTQVEFSKCHERARIIRIDREILEPKKESNERIPKAYDNSCCSQECEEQDLVSPRTQKILRRKSLVILPRARAAETIFCLSLFCLINSAHSECHKTISLTAGQRACSINEDNTKNCYFRETTLLTLIPDQLSCLELSDGNETIGVISLEILEIRAECKKKNEFFTRSYEFGVRSSKRCPWKGECSGRTCAEMRTNHRSIEFSDEINNRPGYTFCRDGCGCWACNCFSCATACIIYRIFATPLSPIVYEVFSCNSFSTLIKAKLTSNIKGKIGTKVIDLNPGFPKDIEDMTIILSSESAPKIPLLGKKFITDNGDNFALLDSPEEIKLRCSNEGKAKQFQCSFPVNEGNCRVVDPDIRCDFSRSPIDSVIKDNNKRIPMQLEDFELKLENKKIVALMKQSTVITVQISLKNMKISTLFENNSCTFDNLGLKGCFNCNTGAKLKYICKTNFGSALGELQCPGLANKKISCSTSAKEVEITLSFQTSLVDLDCKLVCPASRSDVRLNAILDFVDYKPLDGNSVLSPDTAKDIGLDDSKLGEVWKAIKNFFWHNLGKFFLVGGLLSMMAIIVLCVIFFPYILPIIPSLLLCCSTCCKNCCCRKSPKTVYKDIAVIRSDQDLINTRQRSHSLLLVNKHFNRNNLHRKSI